MSHVSVRARHAGRDEELIAVAIDLRPLVDVDDVFQRQRMEMKNLLQLSQHRLAAESFDVDPGDARLVRDIRE